ncbi:ADP-ribosyl-(dinitrogen reductase) hydrolase [Novosphingobium aromaticivorans DSM 12444]|uniref:protein-tyrosine-phosphatase n=1 Tax=Novosphingobium aromaticivorans (strain ATCC 700278 / DSM 12444 / CCUG 56034 / CIP 105152 / NBRC 16084 / F199) TaxID=279238 RepID=Q2GBR6_NOVAD|nr:ADP-ribosylglycohydrolase family protein [Novosphingobium aromaticivorans]ABD24707.1 ADP-ribosyl-(dinitrogen reductase) hydrolase [Novosphingobium aromaticivorans DSM 12444]SCY20026.1 ADP-ribosyl-[dinitrogen reductase] hydrolase [Novosphingobium aromaticivorans]
MRTSQSHPLLIASVEPFPGFGSIGITFCPGKFQPDAMSGSWARDLASDLDAVRDWGATAIVTLVTQRELQRLSVPMLGAEVVARHIDWHHLPIKDCGTPDPSFEAEWETVGEELRNRLRNGFNVLLHCKGGLGRAGTVAARLLVELGWDANKAVSSIREVRPNAIETLDQFNHVLSARHVPECQPDTSLDAMRDRAVGILLGLAVGDAVGTTLEFQPRNAYPRLTDMVGGGPFALTPGEWTDDTSMALALGDSLLISNGLDEADLMRRFAAWRDQGEYSVNGQCFDIGNTVSSALRSWKQSGNPIAGPTAPHTAGNGSLMRLGPIAVRFFRDREAMRDAAARQSRTTHGASDAVDACVAFAEMLANAINGWTRTEVLQSPDWLQYTGTINAIVAGSWRGLPRSKVRASGYVAHSLEASLWSVGRSGTFEQAVLAAANLGEDADTTAAITGQLAGALHGAAGIPRRWLARLAWSQRIREMANALFSQGLGL